MKKKNASRIASGLLADVLIVVGAGSIVTGMAMIYEPAGYIAGGIMALAGGIMASRSAAGDRNP